MTSVEAKFDFVSGCVSAFQYIMFWKIYLFDKYEFGTIITFKFVYTCGCVFFMFGVVCGFVCEVSLECVVCGVCYFVLQFFKTFSSFLYGFIAMG